MMYGEKIFLRAIQLEDTNRIIKWRNQEFVRKNFIDQRMFTKETHEKWMKEVVLTGKVKQFIIYEIKNKIPIGSVYLRDIDTNNLKAEYGIFIGEEAYLGKGIGTEVAKLMLQYAFDKLGLHKVILRVFAENNRAINSYRNAGFIEEGCFQDDVKIEGKYYDIIYMAKLREEKQYL